MTLPDPEGTRHIRDLARALDDPFLASVLTNLVDVSLILSSDGSIVAVSGKADSALSDEFPGWKGRRLADLLDQGSAQKLAQRVADLTQSPAAEGARTARFAELVHVLDNGEQAPVRYALHPLRDSSEVLMLGQDQRPTIEMQQMFLNAQIALERDHEAQREIDTRYRLLMDFTSDAIVMVSISSGLVIDVNHNAASVLGRVRSELVDRPFADCFTAQTRETLLAGLDVQSGAHAAATMTVEIKASQRRLQLSGKQFRASGEQLAIIRMTDPEMGSVGDERLVTNLRQLFNHGSDAIVFTDRDGIILAISDTFLNLTDSPSTAAVRGRPLSEFLARGAVDLRVLLDNARRAGHLRMYATKLNTDFGAQVGVEISATWLDDQFDPVLALVMRNTSSAVVLRPEASGPDANMQGVIELVGSSTLKDIVSETTDVIEKICIETALELTRNNRVAAAEMLGLSRQSLYVKLRKFALVSKDDG